MNSKLLQIIGLIITIIVAVLLFYLAKEERKPVYSFKDEALKIYDRQIFSSKYKLINSDSILIDEDVYVRNVVIWNQGKAPINKEDIRNPISMVFEDNSKILDYKIIKESHPGVGNFHIKEDSNILSLSWEYFDPGFALEIQVMYTGDNPDKFKIEGYVLGAYIKKARIRSEFYFMILSMMIGFYTGLLTTFIYRLIKSYRTYKLADQNEEYKQKIQNSLIRLFGIIIIGVIIFMFRNYIFGGVLPI